MKLISSLVLLIVGSSFGLAFRYYPDDVKDTDLRANDVIPVRFDDTISFSKSREGDRFSARIENDRDLPKGTRLEGRIVEIKLNRREREKSMVLEFNRMVLPNGDREDIQATPVVWNEKNFRKNRDGRWEAKQTDNRDKYVIGGLVGGLVIGSIARKPFEGAFLGAIAGILIGESEKASNDDIVIRKGDKVGALFERDVRIKGRDRDDRYESQDRDRTDGREIVISYQDRELRFNRDEQPYQAGKTIMVPLLETAKQLDLKVEIEDRHDRIYIDGKSGSVRLSRESREYRWNGDRRALSRNLEEKDRVLYVPIEIFEPFANGTLMANGTKVEYKE